MNNDDKWVLASFALVKVSSVQFGLQARSLRIDLLEISRIYLHD